MEVFLYLNTSQLLSDKFREKQPVQNEAVLEEWAQFLGISTSKKLQQILSGMLPLPKRCIPKVVQYFDFSHEEALYFETLVEYEKAKTVDQMELYYRRLNQIRPRQFLSKYIKVENLKYFSNPLHVIIGTMIRRKDFVNDPKWIKNKLRVDATVAEINEVIAGLLELGLAVIENGELRRTEYNVTNAGKITKKAAEEFHRKMSQLASEQVGKLASNDKEFLGFCMNLREDKLEKAKEKLRKFMFDFMEEFEAGDKQSEATYHLNLQLFSLTKK